MTITILDCYTDEPAGLGVPPYIGTYPRYIAGYYGNVNYLTIDDLRYLDRYDEIKKKEQVKTNIKVYNRTRDVKEIKDILDRTSELIIIAGVHTPGKYLSAVPGTLREIIQLTKNLQCKKILTGPAVIGSQAEGGKFFEKVDLKNFDEIKDFNFRYDEIKDYSIKGSSLISQIRSLRIAEIESSHGCSRKNGCSFCTEPLKNRLEFREEKDIIDEIKALYKNGIRDFRIGKQSCFYSLPYAASLLQKIRKECKDINTLHIDNANPANVITKKGEEITKAIVKYCTAGNVAAFGVESFDEEVCKANNLNTTPEIVYKAVKQINKYGKEHGDNGLSKFLPGINLLFGLEDESKETFNQNYSWLKRFLDEDIWIRRINIRQVSIFEGTPLYESVGNKFIRKNKKYYWKWRDKIRQDIDYPMLQKIAPIGHVMKGIRMEIHDGNTTFGRHIGTYPLIVGVKERLELGKYYDIKVVGHMLRSITGEII